MNKIGVGIVGLGGISDFHYDGLINNENVEIRGISDVDGSVLKKRSSEWKVKAYETLEDLLAAKDIDAVHILTPSTLHYAQVTKALEAGKHVLVEKPAAMSPENIRSIESLAKEKNLSCIPCHNHLFSAGIAEAKKYIEEGKLGDIAFSQFFASAVISAKAEDWGWRGSIEKAGGGTLIDSGTHLVYQAVYLFGKAEQVYAVSRKVHCSIEGEDTALVIIRHESGVLSSIIQCWASQDFEHMPEARISGTRGQLSIGNPLYDNRGVYHNGEKIAEGWPIGTTFTKLMANFYEAIVNKTEPIATLQQSYEALRIVQKAYEISAG